ncbi:MAG: LuxR C-terminal-related transcriptional regulator, partial [Gammaproteobacteria bacterium]|nr:LuxR C-terminal-related transcriptional regulator [Gammaproteobacteria bacterium]
DGVAIKGSHYFNNSFIDVVESVVHGESYLDPSLLKMFRISNDTDGLSQLTKREFEVFIQVSVGKSDEEIAKDLSVDILHVKNMRSKISRKTKQEYTKNIAQKLSGNI